MNIEEKFKSIKNEIPKHVSLVAVSKTKSKSDIIKVYNEGQKIFGENKAIELSKKAQELPNDIKWHMIGHLQRNKVKYIAPFVDLIHSIDSISLIKEVNKRALQNNRKINCLLQIHIAKESSKYGFNKSEIDSIIKECSLFKNINIVGLMGMATFTKKSQQIIKEFKELKILFDKIKNKKISKLSMGMSGDYKLAIKEGSTMVRIGSAIFGNRN